jgi:hypothetical protein
MGATTSGWLFLWSWGGRSGAVQSVAATVTQSQALFGTLQSQERSASVAFAPLDFSPAEMAQVCSPFVGVGALYLDGRLVMAGAWRDVQYDETILQVTISQAAGDDAGVIPAEFRTLEYPPEYLQAWDDIFRISAANLAAREWNAQLSAVSFGLGSQSQGYAPVRAIPWQTLVAAFSDPATRAVGKVGPLVYGTPGNSGGAPTPATPAYIVDLVSDPRRLLIARHPVEASSVTVYGLHGGSNPDFISETKSVLYDVDDLGQGYSYVELPATGGGSTVIGTDEGEYFIEWVDGEALSGAAGDLCLYLLQQSTLQVDLPAWYALRPWLNRFRLSGYVDAFVSPTGYLQSVVLPMLPIGVVAGPFGLAPVPYPWADDADLPAAGSLVEGPGFAQAGLVRYLAARPLRSVTVNYGWSARSGGCTRSLTLSSADSAYGAVAASVPSLGSASEVVESTCVWDEAMAAATARLRLAMATSPPRSIPHMADPGTYGPGAPQELRAGQVVTYTCSRLGIIDAPAVVGEVEYDGQALRVTIYLRDDALRPRG